MNLLELARSALPQTTDTRAYRWLIHRPGRPPLEACFLPERTAIEVQALYPGATVEALPIRSRSTPR